MLQQVYSNNAINQTRILKCALILKMAKNHWRMTTSLDEHTLALLQFLKCQLNSILFQLVVVLLFMTMLMQLVFHSIITGNLNMHCIAAKFVPCLLTLP